MTPQEEVKRILFENDKTKTWLANRLGISKEDLSYQLNRSKNYSADLHNRIINILKKEGFITNTTEKCEFLIKQTLQIDSMVGTSLTMLNTSVEKFTKDNILDFRETKRLFDIVEKIRNGVNESLDNIETILNGKA